MSREETQKWAGYTQLTPVVPSLYLQRPAYTCSSQLTPAAPKAPALWQSLQGVSQPHWAGACHLPHGGLRCHKLVSGVTRSFQYAEALVSWCESSHTRQIQITKERLSAWPLLLAAALEQFSVSSLMSLFSTVECSTYNVPCKRLQHTTQVPARTATLHGDSLEGKGLSKSGSEGPL